MGIPNIVVFLRCCFSCCSGLGADDRGRDGDMAVGLEWALSRLEWRAWVERGAGVMTASTDLDLRLDLAGEPRRKS